MRAMILAAGRGERMLPLTEKVPKPLLEIAGKSLIVYQLEAIAKAGIKDVIINLGHLGSKIKDVLGSGNQYGVTINYSDEGENILETAGGIIKALPFLGEEAFIVTNADIYTDFDYSLLPDELESKAHLVLVNNPEHNPGGDFALEAGKVRNEGLTRYTYSGIAVFKPEFFLNYDPGRRALAPLLRESSDKNEVTGEIFEGGWSDVGTPERLDDLNS